MDLTLVHFLGDEDSAKPGNEKSSHSSKVYNRS